MPERSIAEQEAFLRSGASYHVKPGRRQRTRYLSSERLGGSLGFSFGSLAERIVGPRITEVEIEPCIADMQHEYFEARARIGQHGKGPGECERVGPLWPLGGDSTVMLEPMGQRGLIFNRAEITWRRGGDHTKEFEHRGRFSKPPSCVRKPVPVSCGPIY